MARAGEADVRSGTQAHVSRSLRGTDRGRPSGVCHGAPCWAERALRRAVLLSVLASGACASAPLRPQPLGWESVAWRACPADVPGAERAECAHVTVPLEQHEFDALVSFDFYTGGIWYRTKSGPMANATAIKLLNKGDRNGAANALLNWLRPPAVTKRRQAERALGWVERAWKGVLRLRLGKVVAP